MYFIVYIELFKVLLHNFYVKLLWDMFVDIQTAIQKHGDLGSALYSGDLSVATDSVQQLSSLIRNVSTNKDGVIDMARVGELVITIWLSEY